jgi:hypothetical protein
MYFGSKAQQQPGRISGLACVPRVPCCDTYAALGRVASLLLQHLSHAALSVLSVRAQLPMWCWVSTLCLAGRALWFRCIDLITSVCEGTTTAVHVRHVPWPHGGLPGRGWSALAWATAKQPASSPDAALQTAVLRMQPCSRPLPVPCVFLDAHHALDAWMHCSTILVGRHSGALSCILYTRSLK